MRLHSQVLDWMDLVLAHSNPGQLNGAMGFIL